MSPRGRHRFLHVPPGWIATLRVLVGGSVGAALLTLARVPAGAVVGAVVGSAVASTAAPRHELPRAVRISGMILLGCVAGAQLEASSLRTLAILLAPVLLGVVILVALNIGLALLLHHRFGLDLPTAFLACTPGGVSEIAGISADLGARPEVVVSIHVLRVLIVVLGALPIVVGVLGAS